MKKYILLLFLLPFISFGQTANGTETKVNAIRSLNPQTVTSANYLTTMGTDGTGGRILPVNLPINTATQTALDLKVTANSAITGATNTKITYDSKGLVTSGTSLIASDIPNILESQVTGLVSDLASKENTSNKQNSLAVDGTGIKFPTVDATNAGLFLKANIISPTFTGTPEAPDPTTTQGLATKNYADNLVVGLLNDRGSWDASTNLFPTTGGSGTSGAIKKGDIWFVSVPGILAGKSVTVGDSFRALTNTPGQTTGNWSVLEANIGYVPANDANVIHTTGNESKAGNLTLTTGMLSVSSSVEGFSPTNAAIGTNGGIYAGKLCRFNEGVQVFGGVTNAGFKNNSIGASTNIALANKLSSLSILSAASATSGTTPIVDGISINSTTNVAGHTITNNYGMQLLTQNVGINNTELNISSINPVGNWSIYCDIATHKNYFGQKVLIGSTTDMGEQLQVTGTAKITGLTTFTVSPVVSSETANTIASFDATKNLKSLPLATYPSLTELSYGKGVTSAIQTQIDSKASLASPALTGTPTAPTATPGTNTTQLANAIFVNDAISTAISASSADIQDIVDATTKTGLVDSGNSQISVFEGSADNRTFSVTVSPGGTEITTLTLQNSNCSLINENSSSVGGFISNLGIPKITRTKPGTGTTDTTIDEPVASTTWSTPAVSAGSYKYASQPKEYLVSALPTPTGSDTRFAIVTDALAPSYMVAIVGGGSVVCPVFWNGSGWVAN